MLMGRLPIYAVLAELRTALAEQGAAVLCAPPGSGKTTAVPPALLAEPWLRGRSMLLLVPRRLAARAAAARMADTLGETVGETVGYRVRFESRVSPHSRIEVLTEGILTRRLQGDPTLEGVGLVIFDEFHERSLQADLALALCLDARQALRADLRVMVMSATLDSRAVAAVLGHAPVVVGEGRPFPVEIRYADRDAGNDAVRAALNGVRRALTDTPGDILTFLPGGREIRAVAERLVGTGADLEVCPLSGDLSREAQDRAIRPARDGRRRVVLATSIAETSLTLQGIRIVVDSGWSRRPRFDPRRALTRLVTVRVSRAAADQRAGRAGRTGPGVCYRLWTPATQRVLQPAFPPEILDADLASLVLELALWGVDDPATLAWMSLPPAGAWAQARALLTGLGALDDSGRITRAGRAMAELPAHPRLAHMLLEAKNRGQLGLACDLAALVSERDVVKRDGGTWSADVDDRLRLLARWRERKSPSPAFDPVACAQVERASRQWMRVLGGQRRRTGAAHAGCLLAFAYPDRVAQRRPDSGDRYRLAGGRGVRLPPDDPLAANDFLAVAHLDAGEAEGRIHLAAALSLDDIRQYLAHCIERVGVVAWDADSRAVIARSEERLGELRLSTRGSQRSDPEAVRQALLEGIREMGLAALPWTDAARDWQARVLSLRHWCPEDGYPDISDQALTDGLAEWLGLYLAGMSRGEHLRTLDLAGILRSRVGGKLARRVDEGAPIHVVVPSGSRLRLRYTPGEMPVLRVRVQEMFGLADTPTVCWGRVSVMLHLLSPAHRPIQVTQDLRGFWERTYAEVKKELRGRYPKHHWPDDPWSAAATARPKRNPASGRKPI